MSDLHAIEEAKRKQAEQYVFQSCFVHGWRCYGTPCPRCPTPHEDTQP